ncbi:MAG: hypothetical protein HY060_11510 [Proteobacteria bacterium]|nr:hypothetical protein [Pseudomonadota bacterium]
MRGDRLIALFLLGALAFSPPLLAIFAGGAAPLGIPALIFYLYMAWAALVGLLALLGRDRPHEE